MRERKKNQKQIKRWKMFNYKHMNYTKRHKKDKSANQQQNTIIFTLDSLPFEKNKRRRNGTFFRWFMRIETLIEPSAEYEVPNADKPWNVEGNKKNKNVEFAFRFSV